MVYLQNSKAVTNHNAAVNILNLPDYGVLRVEETDHDYHITAEVSNQPKTCAECQSDRMNGHGRNRRVIRDIPTHGKRVAIYIENQRWRCQACGKTCMEVIPAADEKRDMTQRLVKWVGSQSMKRTFASVAKETGLDEKTIRNIFRDHINVLEAQFRFESPKWMGIDEIFLIKPRCVIANIQNNTIVDLLPNRNKETVIKYLAKVANNDKVQFVAMDMWTPYRDAVMAVMPQVKIVIDKFHVVRMANEAMEKTRKGLRAELTLKKRRGLMHDRFVLLKRAKELGVEERLKLSSWVEAYPVLGQAYKLKEDFYAVYEASSSKEDALQRYEAWHKAVTPELFPYFSDLIRAFKNWQPWILNYFDHQVTNTYTESLNSLIRIMNRLGRGYSFEALRAKILFTEGIHKTANARPKFQRLRGGRGASAMYSIPEHAMLSGFMAASDMEPIQGWQDEEPETDDGDKNYGADINTLVELLEAGKL